MKIKNSSPDDDYRIRCPRLGHQIPFSYCRKENQGLPCFKIIDCWYNHFPVEQYLKKDLTSDEWEKTFNRPPRNKIVSLLELIEQAKKSRKE